MGVPSSPCVRERERREKEREERVRVSVCLCVCVCWHLDLSIMCSHVCFSPAGARLNHISVRNTVHGVATGPPRPFSIVQYFFPPRSWWFTFFIIFLIFALRLHPFPPFSVSPYIRMYVRALLGPVGACVRLCLRVLLPADVPSATRVRHSHFSSVNEI